MMIQMVCICDCSLTFFVCSALSCSSLRSWAYTNHIKHTSRLFILNCLWHNCRGTDTRIQNTLKGIVKKLSHMNKKKHGTYIIEHASMIPVWIHSVKMLYYHPFLWALLPSHINDAPNSPPLVSKPVLNHQSHLNKCLNDVI